MLGRLLAFKVVLREQNPINAQPPPLGTVMTLD
jgi:hypothetical protein